MPNRITLFVFFLIALGFFLHTFNLNWGGPFYFHPDERNIASSVSQMRFPEQLNPKFFAYGSLPIYTVFFTGLLANNLPTCQLLWDVCEKSSVNFSQALLLSRFYSALFSTLLIPLLFFLGRKLYVYCHPKLVSESLNANQQIPKQVRNDSNHAGIIAAIFATTSVGFIQFAHFGTFEMWLTLFSVLLFWFCLQVALKKSFHNVIWLALVFGALISIKISSIALLPLPFLALLFRHIPPHRGKKLKAWMLMDGLIHATKNLLIFTITVLLTYLITNPFVQLDQKGFKDSINYESGVALGTTPVFYTAEFYDTIPVLFQLYEVYPFLLNPLLTVLLLPSFLYLFYLSKKSKSLPYFFLIIFFLFLLLSQAIVFVKWTRYMVPTLPFIYLIITLVLTHFFSSLKKTSRVPNILRTFIIGVSAVFAVSYFITAFVKPDTRVAAAEFAEQKIPKNTPIVSEVYDMGIVPFNSRFPNIELYNFYDLDLDKYSILYTDTTLKESLEKADYLILPSQRVIKSRMLQGERFPKGYRFYTALFNGNTAFEKIYETPCDIFCQITYLGSPSFRYEQTANVFDRPTVYIFKKI